MIAHQYATTPLIPRWTDTPPFNNAVNTVVASIGIAGVVLSLLLVLRAMLRERHNLMYQDNGTAGLICCYPFRVLDRRRRRKEAGWEQRRGDVARDVEPPPLLSGGAARAGAGRVVEGADEEGRDDNRRGHSKGLLRGDGTRAESIDITKI